MSHELAPSRNIKVCLQWVSLIWHLQSHCVNKGAFHPSVKFQPNAVWTLGINLASHQLHYHLEVHLPLLRALSTMYVAVKMMDSKCFIHFHVKSKQVWLGYVHLQDFKSYLVGTVLHSETHFFLFRVVIRFL